MALNSYAFMFLFLPLTLGGFWLGTRVAGRNGAVGSLILASLAFYALAGWVSLLVTLASIAITYLGVVSLLKTPETQIGKRNFLLVACVLADVLLLGYFKYKNFFLDTANMVLGTNLELSAMILPLGLSFLTFQEIALLADVHARRVKAVSFSDYVLFTLFFPRAIAGPIVRYEEVMPQFARMGMRITSNDTAIGICLFSIGLFKKTVIADNLASFVWPAFGGSPSFVIAWSGVLAYTFQLYFDFSGYSDMALGVARLFGIKLPMNFNSPMRATSVIEFWSRWHITLTRFLTASIYTPIVLSLTRSRAAKGQSLLQGKRSRLSAIAVLVGVPTFITMTVSGIWHGAGWNFVVWGLMHGTYLTINQSWRIVRPRFWSDQESYERIMQPVGWLLTFTAVTVALVFFRASSVAQAWQVLLGMCGMNGFWPPLVEMFHELGVDPIVVMAALQPFKPFVWVAVLLACVLLLPNAQQLLIHHQPTVDFPKPSDLAKGARDKSAATAGSPKFLSRIAGAMAKLQKFGLEAGELNGGFAILTAILWLLGAMAISVSGAFLYGQF